MLVFNYFNRDKFKLWLSSCDGIHDSVIADYFYDFKQKSLSISLSNSFCRSKIYFCFKNLKFSFLLNKNEFGNPTEVIAGVVEDDYTFLEEKFPWISNEIADQDMYFVFQMFSMDELHIVFEEVQINVC